MSGTQIFIIALLLVVGVLALLLISMRSKTPTQAKLSVQNVFSLEFSVTPEDIDRAANAAGDAAEGRGQSSEEAATEVRSELAPFERLHLQRVLWVDDHPDNNVFEVLALMQLGFLITTATSNDAARRYLDEANFDLVITDLGRGSSDDGINLVRELHGREEGPPVIVYTVNADERRDNLIKLGAMAVEDRPSALIGAALLATRT
ncbi:response regulator [Mycolicibacterium sp. D5.8-2]|jgi:CheY-like chemotaxis protein|uniref:response regulator n=1 Tax=Mycolicibacterium sp. D5.8-2 TaxID=3085903 RepID=UPI00298BD256|nr:response regulator [Mycolicibacterium sp. D5.8-2]MDW5614086.1 response regulator [Mycolicibacterium sp. D5.8-2]